MEFCENGHGHTGFNKEHISWLAKQLSTFRKDPVTYSLNCTLGGWRTSPRIPATASPSTESDFSRIPTAAHSHCLSTCETSVTASNNHRSLPIHNEKLVFLFVLYTFPRRCIYWNQIWPPRGVFKTVETEHILYDLVKAPSAWADHCGVT
jgi:hypothetical protein